jgi:PilZ domain-containing protein/RDD family protein
MEYAPHATASSGTAPVLSQPRRQRRYHRQRVHNLIYVNVDEANGGIIRNLGESGLAIQTVGALRPNQQVQLRFELLNPRARIEAAARVVWADLSGQAGLELIDLSSRVRRQLKDWLFTQLLSDAYQGSDAESIFVHRKLGEEARELSFSAAVRPTIRLAPAELADLEDQDRQDAATEAWSPISSRHLPKLIDSLIVVSALLLFWVLALSMTHFFPAWPVAAALVLATGWVFASIYWFLFTRWIGQTPGMHLARLAGADEESEVEKEEEPRFR